MQCSTCRLLTRQCEQVGVLTLTFCSYLHFAHTKIGALGILSLASSRKSFALERVQKEQLQIEILMNSPRTPHFSRDTPQEENRTPHSTCDTPQKSKNPPQKLLFWSGFIFYQFLRGNTKISRKWVFDQLSADFIKGANFFAHIRICFYHQRSDRASWRVDGRKLSDQCEKIFGNGSENGVKSRGNRKVGFQMTLRSTGVSETKACRLRHHHASTFALQNGVDFQADLCYTENRSVMTNKKGAERNDRIQRGIIKNV